MPAFRALRDLFGRSDSAKRANAEPAPPKPQASLELVPPAETPAAEPEEQPSSKVQQGADRPVARALRKPAETESYTAADIEVLEGLEPVRRRPGMYIGGTDEKALHHLFAEVI